jgi:hypothetical protein
MIRITGLYNVLVCLLALFHRSCDANDDYYVYVDGSAVDNSAAWKSEYTVEGIKYWADYSLQVQSCIQYNNADVIVFSLYEKGYNQCLTGHKPMGTYYVSVPTFAQAYFAQAADNAYHQGLDYTESSLAQYTSCAEYVTDSGTTYYVKLGCASSGVHRLAVNIFTDNTCRNQVTDSSYDSSSAIDVSDIQVSPIIIILYVVNYTLFPSMPCFSKKVPHHPPTRVSQNNIRSHSEAVQPVSYGSIRPTYKLTTNTGKYIKTMHRYVASCISQGPNVMAAVYQLLKVRPRRSLL